MTDSSERAVSRDDLDECWCCGGLHDAPGALCPDCDEAGCTHFGGECQSDHKPVLADGAGRRDPTEDPRACSRCGVHIGFGGDEYCDGCAREIGAKPPLRRCVGCGRDAPEEYMVAIDVSPEDEYYPDFRHLCRGCSGGETGAE